jgi:hypothetical protein
VDDSLGQWPLSVRAAVCQSKTLIVARSKQGNVTEIGSDYPRTARWYLI